MPKIELFSLWKSKWQVAGVFFLVLCDSDNRNWQNCSLRSFAPETWRMWLDPWVGLVPAVLEHVAGINFKMSEYLEKNPFSFIWTLNISLCRVLNWTRWTKCYVQSTQFDFVQRMTKMKSCWPRTVFPSVTFSKEITTIVMQQIVEECMLLTWHLKKRWP